MSPAWTKRLKAGAAAVCAASLLTAGLQWGAFDSGVKAQATESEYYYAATKLYDYKYDTEVNPGYVYNYNQSTYESAKGGNKWQNGSQVPYEMLNRRISAYYSTNHGSDSKPALYFGNFYGSSSDSTTPGEQQWTYGVNDTSETVRYYNTSNGYKNFWESVNNAPKRESGYVPVQGIVDGTLAGYSGSGTGVLSQGGIALPQFDDTFVAGTSYAVKYEVNNGFPFDKDTDSDGFITYYYDSLNKNDTTSHKAGYNRYYNSSTKNFEVIDKSKSTYNFRSDGGISGKESGFYPFNKDGITGDDRTGVNYGFGMRLDIPFSIDNGKTVSSTDYTKKKDAVFHFSGDDDIWVFVDGVLVLDLGGDHARTYGKIDFANGKATVTESDYNTQIAPTYFNSGANRDERANNSGSAVKDIAAAFSSVGKTWNNSGDHVLTVFYMERGLFESNLYMDFNFVPKGGEPVIKNDNDLTVKEQTIFNGINPGLLTLTKAAADRDVFRYSINSTSNQPGITPNYQFPVYNDIDRVNNEADNNTTPLASSAGTGTTVTNGYDGTGSVKGVTFLRTDPFANVLGTDIIGAVNDSSEFYLLYNESAMFHKQFSKHCTESEDVISVGQVNDLNKPSAAGLSDGQLSQTGSGRQVSDYYNTSVFVYDANGNSITSYQGGKSRLTDPTDTFFQFRNKNSSDKSEYDDGEIPVSITEVFINTVKTSDLQIKKDYAGDADVNQKFTFKVQFTNVFGSSEVNKTGDYSDIDIYINGEQKKLTTDGEFTITSQDTAVIKGIPVGTKYQITEKYSNTGYSNDGFTKKVDGASETLTSVTDSSAGQTTTQDDNKTVIKSDEANKTVVVTATNKLDVSNEKIGLKIVKRWVSADEEELKTIDLNLVLQRKASDEANWSDIETVKLYYHSDSDKNVVKTTDGSDTVWTYTKDDLLKYKGAKIKNVTYSYRVLEYSQDGTALLLADDGLFTKHCKVTYNSNVVDAGGVATDGTGIISITNTYNIPVVMPKSGAEGVKLIFAFGITAIALAVAALVIYKRKLQIQADAKRGRDAR